MKSEGNIQIGEGIRAHLESKGLQQQDVAERLGISQSAVSAYYRGKPIGKNAALKWSETFGFRINWLLTGEGSMLNSSKDDMAKQPSLVAENIPQLSNVEILLREMLAEKEAKIDALQDRINELIEENARLRTLMEHKGGTAPTVEGSSAVGA